MGTQLVNICKCTVIKLTFLAAKKKLFNFSFMAFYGYQILKRSFWKY